MRFTFDIRGPTAVALALLAGCGEVGGRTAFTTGDGDPGTGVFLARQGASSVSAANDSTATPEERSVEIGVLANDTVVPNGAQPARLVSCTVPSNGTLSGCVYGSTGSIRFLPRADFVGVATFQYTMSDDRDDLRSTATVTVTVTAVNDAPSFVAGGSRTVLEGADTQLVAGWATSISSGPADESGQSVAFVVVNDAPGLFDAQPAVGPGGSLTFTPAADAVGTASVSVRAVDTGGTADGGIDTSAAQSFTLTIVPVNDAPSFVAGAGPTVAEESGPATLAGWATQISPGPSDESGQSVLFEVATGAPARFSVLPAIAGDGTLTFTPAVDATGTAVVTVAATDDGGVGNGGADRSVPTTFSIVLLPVNDAPLATPQSVTAAEEASTAITLAGSDVDGDPLTFQIVAPPAHGALAGTPPNLTYTSAADYVGGDAFSFRASDGSLESAAATVSITVVGTNDPPTAAAQSVSTDEDTPLPLTLGGADIDGDPLTFSIVDPPSKGVLSGSGGSLVYTPNPDVDGADSFTFAAHDGLLASTPATVSIGITAVNDAPVAIAASYTLGEDGSKSFALAGTDADGTMLTYTVLTQPTNGTLSGAEPNLVYTPNAHFNGTDSFSFLANDGLLSSEPAIVSLVVNAVNDPPVAGSLSVSTDEDTAVAVTLVGSDPVEGSPVTFQIVATPGKGSLSGTAPELTYTPIADFAGTDTFTYKAKDASQTSAVATVTITVNGVDDAPRASTKAVPVVEDTPKAFTLAALDPEGAPLAFTVLAVPSNGTLSGDAPNLTYTPNPNFNGTDVMTFTAGDGALVSSAGTVTFAVAPRNDPPTAEAQSVVTAEDTAIPITLAGSDPVEGSPLTFHVASFPTKGILSGAAPNLTYSPRANVHGVDKFTFRVRDGLPQNGGLYSAVTTVEITITPVNDGVPTALARSILTSEDMPKAVVLVATDPDADPLLYSVATPPAHGTLVGTPPLLTYRPNSNFHGPDSFTFVAHDGTGDSEPATVSIQVSPVNDAPVAHAQTVTTPEETAVEITLQAADVEGAVLTYAIVTYPTKGTLTGVGSTRTYVPRLNFFGTDTFRFRVRDGAVNSPVATVTIQVTPVNDPPVATPRSFSTAEDTPKVVTLLATDPDGDPVTYEVVTAPAKGTLAGSGASWTYTPNANVSGPDGFTFVARDAELVSEPKAVTIAVQPVNDPPVANEQSVTTSEDVPVAITLAGSDPVEGSPVTFAIASFPAHGTLTGSGTVKTYKPEANFHGQDSFTFKAKDGQVFSAAATVTIAVLPVADSTLVANPQSVTTMEDTPKAIVLVASDVEGEVAYTVVGPPAKGVLSGTAPDLLYTPNPNVTGPDSFTFKATSGALESNVATVSINVLAVNDPPVAHPQTISADEDTPKPVLLSASDPEGATPVYVLVTPPSHGTLSGTGSSRTYKGLPNYHGPDSFRFKVRDNGGAYSEVATVTVEVGPVNDAPVVAPRSLATVEDAPKPITLTGTDADGDALQFSIVTPPTKGTLSGESPAFLYVPNANAWGADSFTYKASDGTADSPAKSVTISISRVVDPPTAVSQEATTDEDTPVAITLSGSAAEGGTLYYYITRAPSHGSIVGAGAIRTYKPSLNYAGEDSFEYRAKEGSTFSAPAVVTLTVNPVNDAPVTANLSLSAVEDVPKGFTLPGSDADGDSLTFEIVVEPTKGTIGGEGAARTYTPNPNQTGADSFRYVVSDGNAASAERTVAITIAAVNDAPRAEGSSAETPEDIVASIPLTASDVEGSALQYFVVTSPAHGTLSGSGATRSYAPKPNFHGVDSFTFRARDPFLFSEIVTVSITVTPVNDPPVATAQAVGVPEDTPTAVVVAGTDVDGDPLSYSLVTPPSKGSLSGNAPNFVYTPNANVVGPDSFTFAAADGTVESGAATVTLTIAEVNDRPVAESQSVSTPEDTALTIVLEGHDPVEQSAVAYTVLTLPVHGTLTGIVPNVKYVPDGNYAGPDAFTFRVRDGSLNSEAATVSITVNAVDDPPTADAKSVAVDEDGSAAVTLTGSDVEGEPLAFRIVTGPSHGTVSGTAPDLVYTPEPNFFGSDLFTYVASASSAGGMAVDSGAATVSLSVASVNDPPAATGSAVTTDEDVPVQVALTGSDPVEGSALTYAIVTPPARGTLTGTAPSLTYVPSTDANGADRFTFRVNDGTDSSAEAEVTVAIAPVNDRPVAVAQSVGTEPDTPATFTLSATDVDGDVLTFVLASLPAHGAIAGTAATLTFTPDAGFEGSDSLTFYATDGELDSSPKVVSFSVAAPAAPASTPQPSTEPVSIQTPPIGRRDARDAARAPSVPVARLAPRLRIDIPWVGIVSRPPAPGEPVPSWFEAVASPPIAEGAFEVATPASVEVVLRPAAIPTRRAPDGTPAPDGTAGLGARLTLGLRAGGPGGPVIDLARAARGLPSFASDMPLPKGHYHWVLRDDGPGADPIAAPIDLEPEPAAPHACQVTPLRVRRDSGLPLALLLAAAAVIGRRLLADR